MKKALIIGAAGFVGSYLIDHIQKNCVWSIVVTKMPQETIKKQGIEICDLNILDKEAVAALLDEMRPDYFPSCGPELCSCVLEESRSYSGCEYKGQFKCTGCSQSAGL